MYRWIDLRQSGERFVGVQLPVGAIFVAMSSGVGLVEDGGSLAHG
jgi:hypothetical protein